MTPLNGNRVPLFFTIGFVLASNSFAQVSQTDADQVRGRQKTSLMESVLESAVANGADSLMRAVRAVMPPDALILTGAPSARGFRLEGYGLFFDVEVPAFRPTMAWTLRQMVDDNGLGAATAVNQLKAYIATVQDPRQRAALDRALRRLELQVGPVGPIQQDAAARSGAKKVSAQLGMPAPAQPQVDPAEIEASNAACDRGVGASRLTRKVT